MVRHLPRQVAVADFAGCDIQDLVSVQNLVRCGMLSLNLYYDHVVDGCFAGFNQVMLAGGLAPLPGVANCHVSLSSCTFALLVLGERSLVLNEPFIILSLVLSV